jgi:Large polyvalent protein associated domain 23
MARLKAAILGDRASFLTSEKDTRPYWKTEQRGAILPIARSGYNDRHYPAMPSMLGGHGWNTWRDALTGRGVTQDEIDGAAGDLSAMAMTGGMAAPRPRNSVGMFGGIRAKTADLDALARARAEEAAGTVRENIWRDHGWMRGRDGEWRFEIDDSASRFRLPRHGRRDGPLSDHLEHEALFSAYPELRDMQTSARRSSQRMGGWFDPEHGTPSVSVTAPQNDLGRSVALHEAQHAVQRLEGFSSGGSPRSIPQEVIASERSRREHMSPAQKNALGGGTLVGTDPKAPDAWVRKDIYHALAGENEAFATGERTHLSAHERRARPPWRDFDVPEQYQIVRRDW